MPALTSDDAIMQLPSLCGEHKDAVRCIFDERLNRLKRILDANDQLASFASTSNDAYQFWTDVKDLPEKRDGIRQEFSQTVASFFERITRYAQFHKDEDLTPAQQAQKADVIHTAKAHACELRQN